jgi:hypothetical protein
MISPSSRTTLLFLAFFGCVGAVVAALLLAPYLVVAYYQGPGGERTRLRLGFELRPVTINSLGQPEEVWVFANVRAGGPLDACGVRDGDAWVEAVVKRCGFDQRPEVAKLYELLEHSREGLVSLEVISSAELQQAWWQERWWRHVRQVSIPVIPQQ